MWSRRAMRATLLLMSCAAATLPHQGERGGGGMDRILKTDHHPRPGPDQTDGGEDGARGSEWENEELTPHIQSRSLDDTAETADQIDSSHPDPELDPDPKTPSGTGLCFRPVEEQDGVGRELINAVLEGWGSEREPEREDSTHFGLCSDPEGNSTGLNAVLSGLASGVEKDRDRFHVLHPTKELWGLDEEHQKIELTLRFLLPPPPHPQIGGQATVLVFALGGGAAPSGTRVSFSGQSLHPHRQTVCISAGTRYAVLTWRQTKDQGHGQGHVVLRITVEANQAEEGQERSVQDLLTGEGAGRNGTQGPLLLFQSRTLDSSDPPSSRLTPEMSPSPGPLAPSRTFHFLCALQKFLSEALSSPEQPASAPPRSAPVSLDSLQSLPPLTLGASSSESLLLGLLNSSAPTLFSFPRRAVELLAHRVELDMQPPLVAALRLRLEEALARVTVEAPAGCGVGLGERLQRLRELGELPGEGAVPPADKGGDREAQYRALLLFKALQTVLGLWEEERSLRSARGGGGGGQEASGSAGRCRLQPLTVKLDRYVASPEMANIYNCEGPCRVPLLEETTNHAVVLAGLVEHKLPLARPPCCVPLEYTDLPVVELRGEVALVTYKANTVATRCGCR